jgi:uncharacterized membrane protein
MKFTFKIGDKIKEAWPLYKEHWAVLVMFTVFSFVVQFVNYKKDSLFWGMGMLLSLLGLVISYVFIRLVFSIVDKTEYDPFSRKSLPSLIQFWNYFKTSILYGLCILGGLILFIIPGIYVMGRLMFAVYLSIEKNQGARLSIKESWSMTEGYGWLLFWKSFLIGLYIIAGYIFFFIGSFITYPLGIIVFVMMYREFSKMKLQNPINVAPVEINSELLKDPETEESKKRNKVEV